MNSLSVSFIVERSTNGSLNAVASCLQCAANYVPSEDKRTCRRCVMYPAFENCTCPQISHELVNRVYCIPRTQLIDFPDDRSTYTIEYGSGTKVDSLYLRNNLRLAAYQCKVSFI